MIRYDNTPDLSHYPITLPLLLDTLLPTLERVPEKNRSYGGSVFRHGHWGILVRASDKLARIEALLSGNTRPTDRLPEGLRDAICDLLGYAALWRVYLRALDHDLPPAGEDLSHLSQRLATRLSPPVPTPEPFPPLAPREDLATYERDPRTPAITKLMLELEEHKARTALAIRQEMESNTWQNAEAPGSPATLSEPLELLLHDLEKEGF